MKVTCCGDKSLNPFFCQNTAAEKLRRVLNAMFEIRDQERKK